MSSQIQAKTALAAAIGRMGRSLATRPDRRRWLECLGVLLVFGALNLLLGPALGVLRFELYSGDPGCLIRFMAIAILVPCLSEELFFRAVLLPDPREPSSARSRLIRAAVTLILFVLWHPFNGLFLKTEARQIFWDPGFLLLAALLGGCCIVVYQRTQSIWPSTLIHWVSVVCWKAFLGGRIL